MKSDLFWLEDDHRDLLLASSEKTKPLVHKMYGAYSGFGVSFGVVDRDSVLAQKFSGVVL